MLALIGAEPLGNEGEIGPLEGGPFLISWPGIDAGGRKG